MGVGAVVARGPCLTALAGSKIKLLQYRIESSSESSSQLQLQLQLQERLSSDCSSRIDPDDPWHQGHQLIRITSKLRLWVTPIIQYGIHAFSRADFIGHAGVLAGVQ